MESPCLYDIADTPWTSYGGCLKDYTFNLDSVLTLSNLPDESLATLEVKEAPASYSRYRRTIETDPGTDQTPELGS